MWAVPGASRTEIQGLHGEALRVRIAAPPEGGKANQELLKLLKSVTGANDVTILRGGSSRRKTVLLKGIDAARCRTQLGGDVP